LDATGLSRDEVSRIYERYGFFLQRRARLITRDAALAEDAVHDALVHLMRSGAGYRAANHPLRWLHTVVDRSSIDQLRRGKHLRNAAALDDPSARQVAHPNVDVEARDSVLKVLAQLGDVDQKIAILAFVDGMSQGEIADEVGYSRVTINKRLQAIRESAKDWLTQPTRPEQRS
jgi:RNA polymerase sigma-70 factor, ECF subfamily